MLRWSRELELDNLAPCEENRSGASQHELAGMSTHSPPSPPQAPASHAWTSRATVVTLSRGILSRVLSADECRDFTPKHRRVGARIPQNCLFHRLHLIGACNVPISQELKRELDEVFYPSSSIRNTQRIIFQESSPLG